MPQFRCWMLTTYNYTVPKIERSPDQVIDAPDADIAAWKFATRRGYTGKLVEMDGDGRDFRAFELATPDVGDFVTVAADRIELPRV